MEEQSVPVASPAARSPVAAPEPEIVVTVDEPPLDRLAALRDIARRLRASPDAEETLQFVIDTACRCTGSDAGMLTLQAPHARQVVSGTALGAGPYISVPLRAGGPTFGEIVLTRMSGRDEYASEEETFGELVAEYIAKAVSALRRGTVLSQEEQDFVDRVTEELRTPLGSTLNGIDAVVGGQAGPIDDDALRYLVVAREEAARLLRSMEDLVRIAHLRAPELREMEVMPLAPRLQAAAERHAARAQALGVGLDYRPPEEPHLMQGVPAQLDLVLDQVLDNALKFTASGGRVELTAGMVEGMLRIDVTDNGMGFDAADAGRMVECFARALTAENARVPGLGVGLFLANEIVKNHGGRLWLDSHRDQGTVVHVAMPPKDVPQVL